MNYDKLHEECAVFGVNLHTDEAIGINYNGLLALQHRGQEGAGIAATYKNKIISHKDVGLVSEVFSKENLSNLPRSKVSIGHNRYSTTGLNLRENVGPFVTEFLTGRIATSHNGNIINAMEIKKELMSYGINFHATSDSEVIASLVAYNIMQENNLLKGIVKATKRLKGAFSLIIIDDKGRTVAVRDPDGFRPLCIGKNQYGMAVSSESCGLDACGFQFIRDVKAGEIILIENGEIIHEEIALTEKNPNYGLCIFEYVYFARPDSTIDGLNVYDARVNMGKILAQESPVDADLVCGVPDTGIEVALGYSLESNIPFDFALAKNRYIGRSFIYPTQAQRENAVRLKLNPLSSNVAGKRIVLVDDSIVRGTTSAKIVSALRNAGAREIHMKISSPPFKYTCNFGTDIDSEENLIANKMSLDEIAKRIGVDTLSYISLKGLKMSCANSGMKFCTNCFSGNSNKISVGKNQLLTK